MIDLSNYEIWFLTGSQHLYGPETLEQVTSHTQAIVQTLNAVDAIVPRIVFKPVLKTSDEIRRACLQAQADENCIAVITWMHTFSPAKNWIAGLDSLKKPLAHLHTQFNRDIPWAEIDMNFMNLNQAAHGDREYGFMMSRMRLRRKVIVGHYTDPDVQGQIADWARVACGWQESQHMRVARFGDNMRSVAVTEGDKVEAQLRFGFEVHGYGVGDLVDYVKQVSDSDLNALIDEYESSYTMNADLLKGGARHDSVREAGRIELGIKAFLENENFQAFTTTFEDLHGLVQLPGLGPQRLMAQGYGFAGEGDWKTAAMLRILKVMTSGLKGGTSFMEDYTYHLDPMDTKVLGAHMLEICPSITDDKPSLEVHPLGIGGKADPARLVFNAQTGPAINVALMDMGNRFRLLLNEVDVVEANAPLPKLPVARAIWEPHPDFKTAATAWIYGGGAHHTVFSQALKTGQIADFAEIAGVEFIKIDAGTALYDFKNELRWNDASYLLTQRL